MGFKHISICIVGEYEMQGENVKQKKHFTVHKSCKSVQFNTNFVLNFQ